MATVVGETSGGDPIYEVRSVRLVLRPDATHFNRVAACSKCGREVPGAAVLSPADLDLIPHPVICKSCVSTAGSPMFESERRRPLAPAPSPPEVTPVNGSVSASPVAIPADDARLAALERKLDDAMEQLRISGELQRSEVLAAVDERMAHLDSSAQPQAVGQEEWDEMVRRVDHIAERLMQDGVGRSRVQDLEERMQRLQTVVDAGLDQSRTPALEQVNLQGAQPAELFATLDARVEEMRRANEQMSATQEELRRRLDAMAERLQQLQMGLDAGLARVQSDGVTLTQARGDVTRLETRLTGRLAGLAAGMVTQRRELVAMIEDGLDGVARLGDQLNERLDRLSERTARTEPVDDERLRALEEWTVLAAEADTQRLRAIEQHLEEAAERLAQALESQRAELQSDLQDGLAEVRSAIPEPVPVDTERLEALEERVARTAAQLAEIDDLLALLDSGFGELRSGIEALRGAETQRITVPADVTKVLPAVDLQPVVRVEPEPGRRHGKRSETTAHVTAVAEATEQLALRQRQLEAEVETLERISEATVKGVARASSEAAALAPLRTEIKAVRDELWEHDEALARLTKSVETLRRKTAAPAPAPAAKKAPAAVKRAPAAKSATPAKSATRKPKKS